MMEAELSLQVLTKRTINETKWMTTKLARTRELQSSRRGVRVERGKVEDGDGGEDVRVGEGGCGLGECEGWEG